MKIKLITKIKDEAKEYGIPFWKLPDFLVLVMALINIIGMLSTYYLALNFVDDPRTAVLFVAVESAVILVIGGIIAESSRKVIVNYKLKEEFIDLVSHQIRSPITNIKWNLELLKQEKLNEKQERYVNRLAGSIENTVGLVNDFVYLSRLDQSKKELNLRKVNLKELVQNILKEVKIFASSKEIKLKFIDKSEFNCVKTDQKKIKIVINNIIENALKYSYEKGIVEVEIYNDKNKLIIKVKDNGCGIEQESQPYIFDKFYRAKEIRELSVEGTGVGLYVSKVLIQEMKGSIWFESEKNQGSVFYVSLPAC
jgi:signal transduction histidine kinase